MDIQTKLLVFAADLILPLALGYACRCQTVVTEKVFNRLILNNIFVVCPIVSFLSFWVLPLSRDLLWLPVISVCMGLVPGALAYRTARKKYDSDLDRGSFVMAASLSNLGTIGGLCVFLICGERGYGYQQIIVLFQYVLMFMFCYPLAEWYRRRALGDTARRRVSVWSVVFSKNQIAVLGILLGGVLQLAGVERPAYMDGVSAFFIHLGAWTGLMPVGYSMDFSRMKRYYRELTDLAAIKFVAAPLFIYAVSHLVTDNRDMLRAIFILSCTPVAVNAVVVSRIHGLNVNLGVAAFVVTTAAFLFVVYPILFLAMTA